MWQDPVLAIVNWLLFFALVPTVLHASHKPTLLSSILTAVCLSIICFAYLTLSLWIAAIPVALTALSWFVLAYQRHCLNRESQRG